VPLSHENCYAAGMAHVIQNGWRPGESTLGMMTLSHTMGVHSLVAILLLSGKWVIQRRVHVPEILDLIAAERLTSLYLTPTVYHQLFESDDLADADFSSVRHVASASSNLSRTTIAAIERHVDPDRFVNHYGSTEIYTLAVYDAPDEKLNCVGRAGINTAIRVLELDGTEEFDARAVADTGELGEIAVDATSPEAFDGYLSADTDSSVVDGWFLTGDLGYRDEDGDLFFVGRVDDMINSGGENIYPVEVETVLERHDAVDEAVVVGRPSERWNQTVVAFVTLVYPPSEVDFGTAADALDEHCLRSDELADYKRPRKYFFIDEFSKNYVGKILRRELQKDSLDIDVHGEIEV
jgi:2-furoate---CoA ligase